MESFLSTNPIQTHNLAVELEWSPMRSHLYHLFRTLKTGRKVSFWYGGRSKRELFYIDHFKALEKDFPNFKFYIALSDPLEADK